MGLACRLRNMSHASITWKPRNTNNEGICSRDRNGAHPMTGTWHAP
eukprot:CAMPEP_0172907248 /NCGR_PEP_ID=MMETSP1075-20121228/178449_1 /TAXON_ID=2916 /ORGANISM="Ceratium fusus, Strain PA161109" /LENGTH=45 /DNA_ID= /DNA_START= /DNA_END= /DNA_ORIENTATION=